MNSAPNTGVVGHAAGLNKADLKVLLHVYRANAHTVELGMPAGTPYLYAGNSWKRARALCASGHLKLHDVGTAPPDETLVPVTITREGIDAYNDTLAKATGGKA